jgi:hypothetical protein
VDGKVGCHRVVDWPGIIAKDEAAQLVAQLLDLLGIARGAEAFGQFPTLEWEG